jgi:TonB-dependent SusC/RagA subfamily outer membrane receptor
VIEEVLVVGYGTTSRRKLTASVSQINTEQIENLPSASVVNNLGGRTPGIIVTSSGGGPNSFSTISIRGGGTPIVVIDGVVSEYEDFRAMAPQDIEELNLLKDAAAAAIYGSRAGNGILMVTTKKGANKPFSINYSYDYSLSQPTYLTEKLSSYEQAYYHNLGAENDGYGPYYLFSPEVVEKYRTGSDPYYYPNTDWRALGLNSFAPEQSHNVSLKGGNRKNSYYASLSYYDQGTIFKNSTHRYERYNARVNLTNNFENIGLKTTTGISANIFTTHEPYSVNGSFGHIMGRSPMSLAYTDLGYYSSLWDHPIAALDSRAGYRDYDNNNFNGLFQADWAVPFVRGLTLKSVSDYRMGFGRNKAWLDYARSTRSVLTSHSQKRHRPGCRKRIPGVSPIPSSLWSITPASWETD